MNTSTQKFSEFISDENGEFRMRLSSSEYIQKNGEIYRVSKSGSLFLIEAEEHAQKPWIREIFKRERAFQNRKAISKYLTDPRNQLPRFSANQRIAYNNAKYN